LSEPLHFVEFKPVGYEQKMGEWLRRIRGEASLNKE
jgi:hypothetical protein